ncbi:MAG: single-stranded DNA-binding protein, partial [Nanoarchaeota archaeon]|nr:single-stranded DNA-binding protein [Nanoarchaeota archaeon]
EGYLKTRSWEAENGEKRFRTEIVLQDMIMLEKRSGEDNTPAAPSAAEADIAGTDAYPDEGSEGASAENMF